MSPQDLDKNIKFVISSYKSGKSASHIARQFKVSVWSVISRLNKMGVSVRSAKEQNAVCLDKDVTDEFSYRNLVDGILLGDGQIDPKYVLHLEQTNSRKEWLLQVLNHLKQVGGSAKIIPVPPRERVIEGRKVFSKEASHLYTPSYVENQELRYKWYKEGTKKIPKDLKLTPITLSHWVAGDGTMHWCGGMTLCTNGFSLSCVEFLVDRFKNDINIISSIGKTSRKGQYVLNIHKRDEAMKIKNMIKDILPNCFQYKLKWVQHTVKNGGISMKELRKLAKEN